MSIFRITPSWVDQKKFANALEARVKELGTKNVGVKPAIIRNQVRKQLGHSISLDSLLTMGDQAGRIIDRMHDKLASLLAQDFKIDGGEKTTLPKDPAIRDLFLEPSTEQQQHISTIIDRAAETLSSNLQEKYSITKPKDELRSMIEEEIKPNAILGTIVLDHQNEFDNQVQRIVGRAVSEVSAKIVSGFKSSSEPIPFHQDHGLDAGKRFIKQTAHRTEAQATKLH